jgi:sn-glycerol 3-phosphate transport system substrate-binding protein
MTLEVDNMKRLSLYIVLFLCMAMIMTGTGAGRELEVWIVDWDASLTPPVFQELIEPAFRARFPDVKLNVIFQSWSGYREKLLVAVAGGVSPDVFQVGGADTVWAVHNSLCLPLTQFYERWPQAKELPEAIKENSFYQGHYWSVPTLAAPRPLLYLRSAFEEAGLDPERPPTTWEELLDTAKRLLRNDGTRITRLGLSVPTSGTNVQEFWLPFLEQAGGRLVDDSGRPDFNTEPGVESLSFYVSLYKEQYQTGLPIAGGLSLANKGVGMEIANLIGLIGQVRTGAIAAEDLVVALPTQRIKRAATVFADPLMVAADTDQLEAALGFLEVLMEPDNLAAYNASMGFIPPLRSALQTPYVKNDPLLVAAGAVLMYGHTIPKLHDYFDKRTMLSALLEKAIRGEVSPQATLAEAERLWLAQ